MVKKYIDIPEYKWGLVIVYNFDRYDKDEIYAMCESLGMNRNRFNYSWNILMSPNSGMTISNGDIRMSFMFIGKPTTKAQFFNTLVHECSHVADGILEYYGIPCGGEESAYLRGDIFQYAIEQIANLE